MRKLATLLLCAAVAAPAAAGGGDSLLGLAARRSGLKVRHPVPTVLESSVKVDRRAARRLDRLYPPRLQRLDDLLYRRLGLEAPTGTIHNALVALASGAKAWYDADAGVLRLRRSSSPTGAQRLFQLTLALVDQNYRLRRLRGLAARDRDAALAAQALVDGVAAVAARNRARPASGTPVARFLSLEQSAGPGPGRSLVANLRRVGGTFAVKTALKKFPQTTEQLLHLDKFLERERALPVALPPVAPLGVVTSRTFGELHVRNLLLALGLPGAGQIAAGWGGGRVGFYGSGAATTVALVLRWDTPEDADEWTAGLERLVNAAFPGATGRNCPPLDRCWSSGAEQLSAGRHDSLTVLTSGPASEAVATAIIR